MGSGSDAGVCMTMYPSKGCLIYITNFLKPFTMDICAQATGVGKYFLPERKNCWKMFEKICRCPKKFNGVLTPESRVLNLAEDAIAALAEQASDYASDVGVIRAEAFARFVWEMADRTNMILESVNQIPFSYREVVKSQMAFTRTHLKGARFTSRIYPPPLALGYFLQNLNVPSSLFLRLELRNVVLHLSPPGADGLLTVPNFILLMGHTCPSSVDASSVPAASA
jgi:hypothetical protein